MDTDFMAYEATGDRSTPWDNWIAKASKLSGRDLDGDEDVNGYSLDGAYLAFTAGQTPEAYVASIPVIDFAELAAEAEGQAYQDAGEAAAHLPGAWG